MIRLIHQLKELGYKVPNLGSGMTDMEVLMVTLGITVNGGVLRHLLKDELTLHTGNNIYEYDGDCWVFVKSILNFVTTRMDPDVETELEGLRKRAEKCCWTVVATIDSLTSRCKSGH